MKLYLNVRLIIAIVAMAFAATVTSPLHADDTEIFFTPPGTAAQPNIMFVFDNSGSMGSEVPDTGGKTRLEVVQQVTKDLIDTMEGVNVGVAKFNVYLPGYGRSPDSKYGGHIMAAPVPVNDDTRQGLKDTVDRIVNASGTPLAETLTEVARYFRGAEVFYDLPGNGTQVGKIDNPDNKSQGGYEDDPNARINDGPVSSLVTGGTGNEPLTYVSPVQYECQKNHVVFLTDGNPYQDDTDKDIRDFINSSQDDYVETCGDSDGNSSNNCLDEVAEFLATVDIRPDLPGDQFVYTSTVGFNSNQNLLSLTAEKGKGKYYLASDGDELEAAFTDFYLEALVQSTTYVAPGVAVDTFDRLNHLNTLYYALFQSDKGAIWNGNLKRYELEIQEDADGNKKAVIVDRLGNAAIDETTGFFKDTARSWWSPAADGPDVARGGAASQLPEATVNRKVYSNLLNASSTDLTLSGNEVVAGNLSSADFDLADTAVDEFNKVVSWTRGVDVNDEDGDGSLTDARKLLADPLHSVPQLVIYDATTDPQATTIYYGDNQGFIHGINGDTGASQFSFIPKELLSNQVSMMNSTDASSKVYGMDGSVVKWVHDEDSNGAIDGENDFVRIFSGMRRGGKSYYALNVTNPSSPSLEWTIKQGDTGFAELGQTWSTPVKTRIKEGGSFTDVLIFGGGYDVDQDDATTRTADDEGRALYIVNANTGALIWRAGTTSSDANLQLAEMQYSIPASPKVLDVNGDGAADQVYVGDMGGQIFRFDIGVTGNQDDLKITGGRIANLADGSTAGNRRFYHSPDVFGLKVGGKRYLGLVIGSGYQAHPLDTDVEDRIYMLKIADVSGAPSTDTTLENPDDEMEPDYASVEVTEAKLYDATANTIQDGTDTERTEAATALAGKDGWFIRLTRGGEKVLAEATTVNNEIYITTYQPVASSNPCFPPTGTSRMYHLSTFNGTAVRNYVDLDNETETELTKEDRNVEVSTAGLPPSPQRMRVDDTDVICIGTECRTIETVKGLVETYWYEE